MELLEFVRWCDRHHDGLLGARWWYDHQVHADWRNERIYCSLCGGFQALRPVVDAVRDVREEVVCSGCGLNARVRAALALLVARGGLGKGTVAYATEQVTSTFLWMQKNLPGRVIGSEYESDAAKRTQLTEIFNSLGGSGEVAYNDITDSSHDDGALDAVLSLEVLEHVPDYRKALREFSRTLKPGGLLVATFPFADVETTIVRARLNRCGEVEHLMEPEFHGDPIGDGVLCWYHFGWDLLDACRQAGFADCRMVMPWDPAAGLRFGLWTLVARNGTGMG